MQKLRYKWQYIRRKVMLFFGRCHRCGARLNYTPSGRGICTDINCR